MLDGDEIDRSAFDTVHGKSVDVALVVAKQHPWIRVVRIAATRAKPDGTFV